MFVDHSWPDPQRSGKRCREDDVDELTFAPGSTIGFAEHRKKRIQTLPFRSATQWGEVPSFPPSNPIFSANGVSTNITPVPSRDPEPDLTMYADEPELPSQRPATPSDMRDCDVDMMEMSSPSASQGQPQPTMAAPQPFPSIMGRIPTPITCSFAAQVRGQNRNGVFGVMASHGDALATTPEEPNPAMFANDVGPFGNAATMRQVMADWNMVQENRRLPSPISESGAEDCLPSPQMPLDQQQPSRASGGSSLDHLTHDHPLIASLPPRASSAMEARRPHEGMLSENNNPNANGMDVEGSAATATTAPTTPTPTTPTLSSPSATQSSSSLTPGGMKKGHTRSKHTLSAWTAPQPGMKRTFSIGYRADCEKCRAKVPGHFNHIIIS